jgi:hypothetical protein
MRGQRPIGIDRILRQMGNQDLWDKPIRSDRESTDNPNVLERREHVAAEAFVTGRRWYANRQLEFQNFRNHRIACRVLIQTSRRLIEESRQAILKSRNTLVFSRRPHKLLN